MERGRLIGSTMSARGLANVLRLRANALALQAKTLRRG
jgi:hypothetical protein